MVYAAYAKLRGNSSKVPVQVAQRVLMREVDEGQCWVEHRSTYRASRQPVTRYAVDRPLELGVLPDDFLKRGWTFLRGFLVRRLDPAAKLDD